MDTPQTPKMPLQAIKYTRGALGILNQLKLPHESIYVPIKDSKDGFDAIKRMIVRGAPAIAIVAALALAVELDSRLVAGEITSSAECTRQFVFEKLDHLLLSRPTAVNLTDAAKKLKIIVSEEAATGEEVVERYIRAAEKMLVDDVQDNKRIGDFGAEWIVQNAVVANKKVSVLTHCNTGFVRPIFFGH